MEDKMSDIFICLKYTLVYAIKKEKEIVKSSARQTTANNKLLKSIPSAAFSDQAQVNVAI